MGFLSVIRRWALRDKMPIGEISRRTGLSRNTIKRYLRAGIVEPQFQTPVRPSKLDPFAEKLSGWLVTSLRKSRKERRTAKQMHADLVQLGFDGSYERVAAFVRAWKGDRQRARQTTDLGTFVPLIFQPGEAFQFDWSEDWANIGGERIKLQVAHIKLSHSRAFLVRAYLLQTHEMLFDAHWHGFRVFEGIPSRGIYDNMKTAVDRVGRGKHRDVNARFLAMTSHYVFEPEFCNPAAGWGELLDAPLMKWMAPAFGIAMCHVGCCEHGQHKEPSMDDITTIGVDLAKSVFQLHGVDVEGRPLLRRQLRRSQMLEFFQRQPACLIGMEACASAH